MRLRVCGLTGAQRRLLGGRRAGWATEGAVARTHSCCAGAARWSRGSTQCLPCAHGPSQRWPLADLCGSGPAVRPQARQRLLHRELERVDARPARVRGGCRRVRRAAATAGLRSCPTVLGRALPLQERAHVLRGRVSPKAYSLARAVVGQSRVSPGRHRVARY
jgi:hypothetical protein